MDTLEREYSEVKRSELERWGEYREQFTELVQRCEIVADEIDGMEGRPFEDPEQRSTEGAAAAFDALLPIIEQLGEHGYPEEHAAEMLRLAADRIEESSS